MPTKYTKAEKTLNQYIKSNFNFDISPSLCKYICNPDKLQQISVSDFKKLVIEYSPIYKQSQGLLDGPPEAAKLLFFSLNVKLMADKIPEINVILEENEYDYKYYVGKFIINQYTHFSSDCNIYIIGNMYSKELTIRLLKTRNTIDTVIDTYGYKLNKSQINQLKPLLIWEDYEACHDCSEWDSQYNMGYRDGWGYKIFCMNDSGKPLIELNTVILFDDNHKPCYAKLLDWMKTFLSQKSEFKDKNILW